MKTIFEETNELTSDMFEYLSELFKPEELNQPKQDKEETEDNERVYEI